METPCVYLFIEIYWAEAVSLLAETKIESSGIVSSGMKVRFPLKTVQAVDRHPSMQREEPDAAGSSRCMDWMFESFVPYASSFHRKVMA